MHTPDEDAAVSAMRELILAAESYRAAASSRLGLSPTDSQAVSYLLARGPLGQNELATALGLTTGSVTPLVDRLERNGIARRTPHPTDRRRIIVELSPERSAVLRDVRDWLFEAYTDIPADQLPEAIKLLNTLTVGLRTRSTPAVANEPATAGT